MIKIIFSDMDGTLLTDDNRLPPDFDEVVAELKNRGVIFSPTSGRQYFSLLKSFTEYENEFIFIADGGTFAVQKGKELFSFTMTREKVLQLLRFAEKNMPGVAPVFCGKRFAYLHKDMITPEIKAEIATYFSETQVVDDLEDVNDVSLKMSFFDFTNHAKENILDKLLAEFTEGFDIVQTSPCWVDVYTPGVNKGLAVKTLQEKLNIKPEECAAFGDYMNDYEMLQSVGFGYAMQNARPEIKKVAKFQTVSNNEYGVTVAIKKFIADGLI